LGGRGAGACLWFGVGGAEVPLQSDTRLQADILQESSSLLSWLLNPLRDVGGRI
jgi:hypothetical protein